MMIHVYVAGPYTGDTEGNTARALDVGDALIDAGFAPFIPHLSHYRHARCPRGYEVWMDLDFAWVRRCDVLLRMPGPSSGADREVSLALGLEMPVFFDIPSLIAWRDSLCAR